MKTTSPLSPLNTAGRYIVSTNHGCFLLGVVLEVTILTSINIKDYKVSKKLEMKSKKKLRFVLQGKYMNLLNLSFGDSAISTVRDYKLQYSHHVNKI